MTQKYVGELTTQSTKAPGAENTGLRIAVISRPRDRSPKTRSEDRCERPRTLKGWLAVSPSRACFTDPTLSAVCANEGGGARLAETRCIGEASHHPPV